METRSEKIALAVAEAPESDVGLGRARVDSKVRLALGIDEGGIVEIVGRKGTAAKLFRLMPEDEGKGIVRVDGLVRRNLGVSIGDKVEVRKAEVLPAERVTIAPIISEGHKISFGQGIENFVKRGLLKRPVTKGDVVIVPGIALMGGALPFMVIKVIPKGIVQIVDDSIIEVREALAKLDGLSPDEIYSEFVQDLTDRIGTVLDEFQGALAALPSEQANKARDLASAIQRILDDAKSTR